MISMQQALSGLGRIPPGTRTRSATNSCDSYDGRLKKARASTLCRLNSQISKPTCTGWRKCTQRQRNRRREKGAAPQRNSPDPTPFPPKGGCNSMIPEDAETRTRRYRGVSYRGPIDAAKEAVSVTDLAERLTGPGVRRGREIAFRCPLHDDHDPSLRVDPDKGVWFCDPCLRGGDVVELARLAWGYDQRDAHVAAANLLHEFGHEIPQRSPAWFRKQERQKPRRDAVEEVKMNVVRRRLFRHLILPLLNTIEDEEEHDRELDRAWSEFQRLMR